MFGYQYLIVTSIIIALFFIIFLFLKDIQEKIDSNQKYTVENVYKKIDASNNSLKKNNRETLMELKQIYSIGNQKIVNVSDPLHFTDSESYYHNHKEASEDIVGKFYMSNDIDDNDNSSESTNDINIHSIHLSDYQSNEHLSQEQENYNDQDQKVIEIVDNYSQHTEKDSDNIEDINDLYIKQNNNYQESEKSNNEQESEEVYIEDTLESVEDNNNENDLYIKQNNNDQELKDINDYTFVELKELAKKNDISISRTVNKKTKIYNKKQLYEMLEESINA